MFVTLEDNNGLHKRMSQLREMEIGLDGAICAKGGEVRVHLPYMAACNQTLFDRITGLMKQGRTELNARNITLHAVQLVVEFCYSGKMEITENSFEHIIDAAFAMEFLNIVEKCVQFALNSNVNANTWCHFLGTAFKHPCSVQPKHFVPNLISQNIREIPKEAILKALDPVYIGEILQHGTISEKNRCYMINLFLEMMLVNKVDVQTYKDIISLIRDIVEPDDKIEIPRETSDVTIMQLIELSLEINFSALIEACVETFDEDTPSTATVVSQMLKLMEQYETSQCSNCLKHFAFKNFPQDISEDGICSLLTGNCLGQISEFEIFKRVQKWIDHNDANAELSCKLIRLVRFGLLTKEEMDQVMAGYELPGCEVPLVSAVKYHLKIHQQPLIKESMNTMRQDQSTIYIIGGEDQANNWSKKVLLSKVSCNKEERSLSTFTEVCQTPMTVLKCGCAELNHFIFVAGGKHQFGVLDTLWRFDLRTNAWLELRQMAQKRDSLTLTVKEDSLVAVGGSDEQDNLNTVEMYDIKKNTWTEMESLPEARTQHAASCVEGMLYISGGSSCKTLFCFEENKWQKKAPMLYVRQAHSMCGVSGMLFVIGGVVHINKRWRGVMSTECYDIIQDQWTELAAPKVPFALSVSVQMWDWLYIFGGKCLATNGKLDSIQRYNLVTNTWELCDIKLPHQISGMVGASITCP